MEIEVTIGCDADDCRRLASSLKPDDTENWKTTISDHSVIVNIKTEKITSLYNLVDDLLRSYEVFKKIDGEQL